MKSNVSARIKRSLIGLSLVLCVLFTALTVMLVYVIEDGVFVNSLHAEQKHFEQVEQQALSGWQPHNRFMHHHQSIDSLPPKVAAVIGDQDGVYEFFDDELAMFVLAKTHPADRQRHFIAYDVSELLAVKESKQALLTLIGLLSLVVVLLAFWVAGRLTKVSMQPLRELVDQLQNQEVVSPQLTQQLAGDEAGVLAEELAGTIQSVQQLAQRELAFNRGMSHELRTPLQVANNALSLLQMGQQSGSPHPAMERLQRAIADMERITQAFLWLASQSRTQKSVDVEAMVNAVQSRYAQANPRQVFINRLDDRLRYSVPGPVFDVMLDNLWRNAIQHGSGGEIHSAFDASGWEVVNPIDLDSDQRPGHGVGLAIVQGFCDELGWHLSVENSNHQVTVRVETGGDHRHK